MFFLFQASLFGQNLFNKRYEKIIGDTNYFARANGVVQTSDSAYVIVGTNTESRRMSALKLNKYGDTLWSYVRDLGEPYACAFSAALETKDGHFIIVGQGTDTSTLYQNAVVVKLNKATGDTIWFRQSGLPKTGLTYIDIEQTSDNGLILCGMRAERDSLGWLYSDVYLVKRNSIGVIQWERSYDINTQDIVRSIEIASDGGFMLFGSSRNDFTGEESMFLIKTDSLGELLWQNTYGGPYSDWGLAITKLQDGNFLLAGGTSLNSNDASASLLIKIDPEGNIIWQKKYFGEFNQQEFSSVKQLATGEIVVCGSTKGDADVSFFGILKVLNETDGSIIWEKQYQFYNMVNTDQYFYSMDLCSDGGFILAGMARNLNPEGPGNSMWVVKTDCMGNDSIWDNAACPIKTDTPDTVIPFNLYPNPSTGAVTVDYFIPQNAENQSISFYDATGKLVQKVVFTGEGQIQLNIDCSGFSNGVYQCVLVSDGEVLQQGKLVLIK